MRHNILMVSDLYRPFIGGAERQIGLLSKQLVRRGHSVSLATIWHSGLPEHEADDGVDIYRLKSLAARAPRFLMGRNWQQMHPPLPDPGVVVGMRQLINRFKPDVVQSYGWITFSVAAALLGTDIPLIVSSRDYAYSCATRRLHHEGALCDGPSLQKCLGCAAQMYGPTKGAVAVAGLAASHSLLLRKTRAFHSVSAYVQSIVQRDMLRSADKTNDAETLVLHNLFDPSTERAPDPAFIGQLPSEPFILFVGGLQMNKGVGVLLEAYQQLESPPPLVLIGATRPDSPHEFPDNVIVLRDVPHPEVMVAWERCLFGVLPSVWPDPLPNVVLEAMSRGKAAIGTSPGGFSDMIVDGETGAIVPAGDAPALTAVMQQLIADAPLREQMGRAARRRLHQRFLPDVIVPQFEQLYERLVTNTGSDVWPANLSRMS